MASKPDGQHWIPLMIYEATVKSYDSAICTYAVKRGEFEPWGPARQNELLEPFVEAVESKGKRLATARKMVMEEKERRLQIFVKATDDGLPTYVQTTGTFPPQDQEFFEAVRKANVEEKRYRKDWSIVRPNSHWWRSPSRIFDP